MKVIYIQWILLRTHHDQAFLHIENASSTIQVWISHSLIFFGLASKPTMVWCHFQFWHGYRLTNTHFGFIQIAIYLYLIIRHHVKMYLLILFTGVQSKIFTEELQTLHVSEDRSHPSGSPWLSMKQYPVCKNVKIISWLRMITSLLNVNKRLGFYIELVK